MKLLFLLQNMWKLNHKGLPCRASKFRWFGLKVWL